MDTYNKIFTRGYNCSPLSNKMIPKSILISLEICTESSPSVLVSRCTDITSKENKAITAKTCCFESLKGGSPTNQPLSETETTALFFLYIYTFSPMIYHNNHYIPPKLQNSEIQIELDLSEIRTELSSLGMNQVNSWMMAESFPTQPSWTREEDKLFEHALVLIPPEDPERWRKIAGIVVGKSPVELLEHYDALVRDVREIDSGRVELPNYTDDSFMRKPESRPSQISFDSRPKQSETERKKGLSWTREEHEYEFCKLFLGFRFICSCN